MSKMLLEHGVDPNHKDTMYKRPLSIAISKRNYKIIDLLLQYGAKTKKEILQNETLDMRWSKFLYSCSEEDFSMKLGCFVADEAGKNYIIKKYKKIIFHK